MVNEKASMGFVIRDENTRVITMRGEQAHCTSIVGAKTNAARKGIIETIKLKIKDLIIEGDKLCMINALRGARGCPWRKIF